MEEHEIIEVCEKALEVFREVNPEEYTPQQVKVHLQREGFDIPAGVMRPVIRRLMKHEFITRRRTPAGKYIYACTLKRGRYSDGVAHNEVFEPRECDVHAARLIDDPEYRLGNAVASYALDPVYWFETAVKAASGSRDETKAIAVLSTEFGIEFSKWPAKKKHLLYAETGGE